VPKCTKKSTPWASPLRCATFGETAVRAIGTIFLRRFDPFFLVVVTLIFIERTQCGQTPFGIKIDVKFHIDETLRFWIDFQYQMQMAQKNNLPRMQLIAEILRDHEKEGHAMRYLNSSGQVAWKATPLMLSNLADLQRDAEEDLADFP
jgi:hypothetical protein